MFFLYYPNTIRSYKPVRVARGAPVKEVVQKILETEKEVREEIERAHTEAQTIVRQAEERSRAVEDEVRRRAMRESQETLDRMKREADEEHKRLVDAAKGGSSELIAKRSAEIKAAAERVINLILGIEARQRGLFDDGGSR